MEKLQEDQVSGTSIDNLPPEMLQMVLKNLDASFLFACRLVCQKWKVMSNYILRDRPETELFFNFSSDTVFFMKDQVQGQECEYKEQKGKFIQDFLECVNQPENSSFRFRSSPFTKFSLIDIKNWDESIIKFLSLVSPTVTCLKLRFARSMIKDEGLVDKLRNLLLHETPCLKEFGLGFEQDKYGGVFSARDQIENLETSSKVLKLGLFPSPENNSTKKDVNTMKLAKLKVLQLGYGYEDESTAEMVRDILRIAPNLEKIQYLVCDPNDHMESPFCGIEDFLFFLDFGKMTALKHVCFDPSSDFLDDWKNALQARKINLKEISSFFKIEDLQLCFDKQPKIKHAKSQWMMKALQLLERILEGSKNTLEKLSISNTVEFSHAFTFPTFTKLTHVDFWTSSFSKQNFAVANSMFPAGCRLLNIFPNVETLDLGDFSMNLKHFFPRENSIPLMPSVHTLIFKGLKTNGEDVQVMALLCPNLKTLKHVNLYDEDERAGLEDFPSFGRAVWINMKNLEYLHLIINADTETNSFPALDSTLTGISKENCLRLFKESEMNGDVQSMENDPEVKLSAESELRKLKINESILDLPKLKELKIRIQTDLKTFPVQVAPNVFSAYKSYCIKRAEAQVSPVSEVYALKLMPDLNCKITGESDSYPEV